MESALMDLRAQLDEIDARLIELVGHRFRICSDIARVKQNHAIPMMQTDRIRAVKSHAAELAARNGISIGFAERLFDLIIDEACRLETQILEQAGPA